MENKYLLRVRRRIQPETGGPWKAKVFPSICSAREILDFIEFYDFDDSCIGYDIKLIDSRTFQLHKVRSCTVTSSYETGAHYRYIYKGTHFVRDGEEPEEYLDCQFYSHDH